MPELPTLPYDILDPAKPPLPPPNYTWWWVGLAIVLITSIVFALLHWRRTRLRRLARRQLAQARQSGLAGSEAAFAIAVALRTGFGVPHLLATAASDARWRDFVERLDRLRYGTAGIETPELNTLFEEAARWLRGKAPC